MNPRGLRPRASLRALPVLVALPVALVLGAATVVESKAVLVALGLLGLVVLLVLPRHVVGPAAILSVLASAFAVGAPGAPETGWITVTAATPVLAGVAILRGGPTYRGSLRIPVLLTAFVAYLGLVTLLASPSTVGAWLLLLLAPVLLVWLTARLSEPELRTLLAGVVLLGVAEAVLGALAVFALRTPIWGYLRSAAGLPIVQLNPLLANHYPRAQGSLGQPVVFGFVLAVALVIAWVEGRRWRRPWRMIAVLVLSGGLALSGTRSALAAAVVGVLVAALAGRDLAPRLRALAVIVIGGAAALSVYSSLQDTASQIADTGSYTHRLGAIDAVPGLLQRPGLEALLGSGTGSEPLLFARGLLQTDGFLAVDNELVDVLAIAGAAGLILFLLLCLVALLRARPGFRPVLVTVFVLFFSFDVTSWNATACLLAVVLAAGGTRRMRASPSDRSAVETRRTEEEPVSA